MLSFASIADCLFDCGRNGRGVHSMFFAVIIISDCVSLVFAAQQRPLNTLHPALKYQSASLELLTAGRQFNDHYQLIEPIGSGCEGNVYLAATKDGDQREHVAVKSFKEPMSIDKAERTEREILVLNAVKHENIVGFKGAFRSDNYLLVCLEYLDGKSLEDYSFLETFGKPKPLDVVHVKVVLRDILAALSYLHSANIIHRDVKPSNIVLLRNGQQAKLIDFGLCSAPKEGANRARESRRCGTPSFIAPEIIVRAVEYDGKVDIWSLGITIMSFFINPYPFNGCKTTAKSDSYSAFVEKLAVANGPWCGNFLVDRAFIPFLTRSVVWNASDRADSEECLRLVNLSFSNSLQS